MVGKSKIPLLAYTGFSHLIPCHLKQYPIEGSVSQFKITDCPVKINAFYIALFCVSFIDTP